MCLQWEAMDGHKPQACSCRIKLKGGVDMDVLSLEVIVFLLGILAFGSSLIHYTVYARSKAKVALKRN